MNFLYWNINKKKNIEQIKIFTQDLDLDVIILSECQISPSDLLVHLNRDSEKKYYFPFSPIDDPLVLISYPDEFYQIIADGDGASVRQITHPLGIEILLIIVHLPSKLYYTDHDYTLHSTRLRNLIEDSESRVGHRRTLVVGDFNMDPFEPGIVGADGFHAIIDKKIASKGYRLVNGKERHFFYNPMWKHFGNDALKPQGSYYYNSGKQVNYFWHIFDQVILRNELFDYFDDDSVKILDHTSESSLINKNGIPNKSNFSDHLPIKFSLDIIKGVIK